MGVKIGSGGLDDDFYKDGLLNVISRASTGQTTLRRMDRCLAVLTGKAEPPKKIDWRIKSAIANDVWRAKLKNVENLLAPAISKGQPTVLLDEPESGMSLLWQAALWRKVLASQAVAERCQIICASHSPFCLGIPHAHYIEMEKDYIANCQQEVMAWAKTLVNND